MWNFQEAAAYYKRMGAPTDQTALISLLREVQQEQGGGIPMYMVRAAAEYYGYRPGQPIPDRLTLAAALKPQGDGTVCAKRRNDGPCLMTFANEGGAWRLVAVAPDMAKVKGL